MRISNLLLLFLLFQLNAFAQKEATHWYFGRNAGLDFSQGCPEAKTDGVISSQKGSAVISDKETGNLLFYTNGRNFWDREHAFMPNGQDLPPDCSANFIQSALIVPFPGQEFLFYVFTISYSPASNYSNCGLLYPTWEISCEVRYSVVDMRLNGGRGDVDTARKNILVQENATSKLTAVPHANGTDFWLLTHAWNSNAFHVYRINDAGIGLPAVQPIGSEQVYRGISGDANHQLWGAIKASPNGKKIACTTNSFSEEHPFDLFDFDPATGILSNYLNLGNLRLQGGVSFSPDNSKLYVDCFLGDGKIRQYDLAAGSPEAVISSGIGILVDNPRSNIPKSGIWDGFGRISWADLQIGPDGKIYVANGDFLSGDMHTEKGIIVIIHQPNKAGLDCDIQFSRFDFGDGWVTLSLPNFIQSYFNGLEPSWSFGECEVDQSACQPELFTLFPNPATSKVKFHGGEGCAPSQAFSLRIVNAIGQEVMGELPELTLGDEVDLSPFAAGVYFLVFTFPERRMVRRVVKVN